MWHPNSRPKVMLGSLLGLQLAFSLTRLVKQDLQHLLYSPCTPISDRMNEFSSTTCQNTGCGAQRAVGVSARMFNCFCISCVTVNQISDLEGRQWFLNMWVNSTLSRTAVMLWVTQSDSMYSCVTCAATAEIKGRMEAHVLQDSQNWGQKCGESVGIEEWRPTYCRIPKIGDKNAVSLWELKLEGLAVVFLDLTAILWVYIMTNCTVAAQGVGRHCPCLA